MCSPALPYPAGPREVKRRFDFDMQSLKILVSNIYIFHFKHAFIKGIWDCRKIMRVSILQKNSPAQVDLRGD